REDLYYRIDVLPLHLAPLRDRQQDIAPLVRHFLTEFGDGHPLTISDAALQRLEQYPWPGNVRELRNRIEVAVALADTECLEADAFTLEPP
ncbi:MAG TPA: sigma-54-dependent Fis family transcriptional regulator, partial [Proteobacteria bacterium]|nr:sigma-54-dependent Fis family transcriptional regulator [Pseudomonadota bacterium]